MLRRAYGCRCSALLAGPQVLEEDRDKAREVVQVWERKQQKIQKEFDHLESKVESVEIDLDTVLTERRQLVEQARGSAGSDFGAGFWGRSGKCIRPSWTL